MLSPRRKFMVGEQPFELPARYEFVRDLGKGAYGFVGCCKVLATGDHVAVKKVTILSEIAEARRVFREIKILRTLFHPNCLSLIDLVASHNYADFNAIYVVTEFYPADLSQIIKSPQPLSEVHVQTFTYQLLRGLKYLHSANVLHRDLKPNNILVNRECDLSICDFGLARVSYEVEDKDMTQYVVTRWYRAPELIMLHKEYSYQVDIWAAGCIMAELMTRRPLFPGADYVKQLQVIIELLGTPSEEDLAAASGNERASRYAASLGSKTSRLPQVFKSFSPAAVDLLSKLLQFNPNRRPTAAEALNHPFLADVRDPSREYTATHPLEPSEFEAVEKESVTLEEVRRLIWGEVQSFDRAAAAAAGAGATGGFAGRPEPMEM